MFIPVSSILRVSADQAVKESEYWTKRISDVYGLEINCENPFILRSVYRILSFFPPKLIKDCGVKRIVIRSDMGPNKPFYPNHGYFIADYIALNQDIFVHPDIPDDFRVNVGEYLTRPEQTMIHELGHGYDAYHNFPSGSKEWLSLSGWSEKPANGLRRMVIRDKGVPERKGEWYYSPEAKFTRFYAKMNPWDDFADSFAYCVGGLKEKVPSEKRTYMDQMLSKYYA